ncbi:hypothetical protein MASR2M48_22650 [Spirochaetota bacterium]
MAIVHTRRELRLAGRINLVVVSTLILGLGLVAYLFASSLAQSRESLSDTYLQREADILYLSIENFMMPGEAPIAAMFFEDVSGLGSGFELALYRRNGVPAFSDNATITQVNANLQLQKFSQRLGPSSMPSMSPDRNYFDRAVAIPPESVFFTIEAGGRTYKRVYRPLLNLPKCTTCHGSDHTIRGVIDIQADLSDVVREQAITVAASIGGFALMALVLAAIIGRILRSVVVLPVLAIGRLCQNVTGGDFTGRVNVDRKDEIGGLADTVNEMVEGLRERSELTKYVSAGTISSLASDQGPTRAERTLLFSDVRGFTAYTELHGAEAIVTVLNRMLERQASIVTSHGGDIDKFVGDEVVAVFSGDDAPQRAALAAIDIMEAVAAGPPTSTSYGRYRYSLRAGYPWHARFQPAGRLYRGRRCRQRGGQAVFKSKEWADSCL